VISRVQGKNQKQQHEVPARPSTHGHRRNIAEKAIQVFKAHLISGVLFLTIITCQIKVTLPLVYISVHLLFKIIWREYQNSSPPWRKHGKKGGLTIASRQENQRLLDVVSALVD
jgi:hypothetical protein